MSWTLKYVGGASTFLYYALKDGRQMFAHNEPFDVDDYADYRRLISGDNPQFVEVSPAPVDPPQAVGMPVPKLDPIPPITPPTDPPVDGAPTQ